ncbi:hypothetical protein D3C80_1792270 [compost metagenome]
MVFSAAGAMAAPAGRVLELSIEGTFIVVFVERVETQPDRAIAGAVPGAEGPD